MFGDKCVYFPIKSTCINATCCAWLCAMEQLFYKEKHMHLFYYKEQNLNPTLGWKHNIREPRLLSHCTFILGSHVWASTLSLLWSIFTMSLHIMVGQNPKKSNANETKLLYLIWCDVKVYLCKKNKNHNIWKNENIFKKWLKWFLVFKKFVVSTKHFYSIRLE